MALRMGQDFHYKGQDWWDWSVWIDASAEELDQIKAVTYVLHSSFTKPVRTVTDRSSQFRLETTGWGTFVIHAKAEMSDGRTESLAHELRLEYPDGEPTQA